MVLIVPDRTDTNDTIAWLNTGENDNVMEPRRNRANRRHSSSGHLAAIIRAAQPGRVRRDRGRAEQEDRCRHEHEQGNPDEQLDARR